MRTWIGLLLLIAATRVSAATAERVLLPVAVSDVPGANGSVWMSELWGHFHVDGVSIAPLRVADVLPLHAGSQRIPVFLRRPGETPGLFMHVTAELSETIDFNLRVRDLSRASETWGTEIPVVRESEFRSQPISLVPLPIEPGFRNTLRVYAANESGGDVRVRVTLIDQERSQHRVLYEQTHTLTPTGSIFLAPYLQLAIDDVIGATDAHIVRVDIEPVTADLRIWAFASTTHNETQHFTTITPQ